MNEARLVITLKTKDELDQFFLQGLANEVSDLFGAGFDASEIGGADWLVTWERPGQGKS